MTCWASTSSAPGRKISGSSSPSSIASSAARASRYSKRLPGTRIASDGSSSRWLARPIRCSSRDEPLGAPIWMTRSTSPQSTPRSRLAVQTSARSSPARHRRLDLAPRLDRQRAVVDADRQSLRRSPPTDPGRSARRGCACCRRPASSCAARSRCITLRRRPAAAMAGPGDALVLGQHDRDLGLGARIALRPASTVSMSPCGASQP